MQSDLPVSSQKSDTSKYDICSSSHRTRSLVGLVLSAHNPAYSWVSCKSLPVSPCSGREVDSYHLWIAFYVYLWKEHDVPC